MKPRIKVCIVDDNIFLAKSFERKLSYFEDVIDVVFTSEGYQPILTYLESNLSPDVILMDIEMPEVNGIELTQKIKADFPSIKVIMLTIFDESEIIFEAIKAGASGYLLKEIDGLVLKGSIIDIYNGGAAMSPSIAHKIVQMMKKLPHTPEDAKSQPNLSNREMDVLLLLKTGITYHSIGESLHISEGTVRKHIENIYKKLHAHNKIEAIESARKYNLI